MELELAGARVIVTAGASGIGRQIVSAYLHEGAQVELCDVDEAALERVSSELPAARSTLCDVVDRSAVTSFIDEAAARMGGLDILINNAGIAGPTAAVQDIHPEDWDRCIAVCLTAQFNCTRIAVPHLRQSQNGSIVNLSSAAGHLGFGLRTPYAAAKWGVIGFTKSLAIELGADGIRVNAILPGIVAGERQRRVMHAKAEQKGLTFSEIEAEAFSYASIKDYITVEQLADYILFITSPRGRTVSGQAISICGDLKMLA
ncbi:MAG: SDR family oxidoreductase [Granulosicoccus sp.]|nr:SDR family oxidoreductase [Granulosicoccus sp.]